MVSSRSQGDKAMASGTAQSRAREEASGWHGTAKQNAAMASEPRAQASGSDDTGTSGRRMGHLTHLLNSPGWHAQASRRGHGDG